MDAFARCALVTGLMSFAAVAPALAAEGSGADFGARDPMPCVGLQQDGPPSVEQAAALVQCELEVASPSSGELRLIKDIQVQIGKGIPGPEWYLQYSLREADTEATVYPIRGAITWSVCITTYSAGLYGDPALNCREYDIPQAKGVCWQTTFADWRCTMSGDTGSQRELTAPLQ